MLYRLMIAMTICGLGLAAFQLRRLTGARGVKSDLVRRRVQALQQQR
jgi:hypothetical protein